MKLWKKLGLPSPKSEASKGELSLSENEIYSGITVPEGYAYFVRLDGWKFHCAAERLKLKKPYDKKFANALIDVAKAFFPIFNPFLAYVFSDEINLLFLNKPGFERVEKIDSVFAGIASSVMSLSFGERLSFDCRVIPVKKSEILKYLIWRQAECWRNFHNAYAQWAYVRKGMSARAASKKLDGLKIDALKKEAKRRGIDTERKPSWEKNGILLYWESYKKKGFDPIRKKKVIVERKRVKESWEPPVFAKTQ